jgi:hypothetical protein
MLRDIVEAVVSGQPDMECVNAPVAGDLREAIGRERPDVVILADSADHDRSEDERTCVEHPFLKLVVVTQNGGQAELLEFRRLSVPDLSPQCLLDLIRAGPNA